MRYNEEQSKAFDMYKELMNTYEDIVSSEEYKNASQTLPFDFLEAKQKAEILQLYKSLGENGQFHLRSAEEAISFYVSIGEVKKKLSYLLDGASAVEKADTCLLKINQLIDDNPYLSQDLKLARNDLLADLSKQCLKLLPEYPKLTTKKFRTSFIKSCFDSLTPAGLVSLARVGIIKPQDISIPDIDPAKRGAIADYYGIGDFERIIRVRGTSYTNEDGVKRQDVLKKIAEEKGCGEFSLTATKWKPEGSENEKDAIEIRYNGQMAGFVPQEVVDEIFGELTDPNFSATFSRSIGGGNGLNYGLEILLRASGERIKKNDGVEMAQ